jgi:hypothetical protein
MDNIETNREYSISYSLLFQEKIAEFQIFFEKNFCHIST